MSWYTMMQSDDNCSSCIRWFQHCTAFGTSDSLTNDRGEKLATFRCKKRWIVEMPWQSTSADWVHRKLAASEAYTGNRLKSLTNKTSGNCLT